MLYDPNRHEALHPADADAWDEARARASIAAIVRDTEARFSPQLGWPVHPLDLEPGDDPQVANPSLYFGACGVLWALSYLSSAGAVRLERAWPVDAAELVQRTRSVTGATPEYFWISAAVAKRSRCSPKATNRRGVSCGPAPGNDLNSA